MAEPLKNGIYRRKGDETNGCVVLDFNDRTVAVSWWSEDHRWGFGPERAVIPRDEFEAEYENCMMTTVFRT